MEDVHRQAMMSVLLSPDTGSSSCLKFLSLLSNTGSFYFAVRVLLTFPLVYFSILVACR